MSLADHMADVVALHRRALTTDLATDDELVHDLRVALRRCRSLAQGLVAVDLAHARAWKELSTQAKGLFDGLGALRDTQVMAGHARRILGDGHAVVAHVEGPVAGLVAAAAAAVAAFDVAAWMDREQSMPTLADGTLRLRPVLTWLALVRFDEARALHVMAMRRRNPESLHATRIGVKRLRYTLESLLPRAHAIASKPLKKLQELLGDIHDLDVLHDAVVASNVDVDGSAVAAVAAARAELLAGYKLLATGRESAWTAIRRALPVDAVVISRCRRAFVVAAVVSAGAPERRVREAEHATRRLNTDRPLTPTQRVSSLLTPLRRRRRRWVLRRLLGFSDDEKAALRSELRTPLLRAVRAYLR